MNTNRKAYIVQIFAPGSEKWFYIQAVDGEGDAFDVQRTESRRESEKIAAGMAKEYGCDWSTNY